MSDPTVRKTYIAVELRKLEGGSLRIAIGEDCEDDDMRRIVTEYSNDWTDDKPAFVDAVLARLRARILGWSEPEEKAG